MEAKTKVLVTVTIVVVIVAAGLGALMTFNKSPNLFDSEFKVIVTGSMDGEPQPNCTIPTIPVNSLIAVHKLKGDMVENVKEGDVIGFYSPALGANIYHRVKTVDSDNRVFITHGDANPEGADETVPFDKALGVVVNVNHGAGEAVNFIKKNFVLVIVFVVALFIMIEAVSYLGKLWKE